jgi:hypothetical protein
MQHFARVAGLLTAHREVRVTMSPYLLVHSHDGGQTWRDVMAGDPVHERMPAGWLE